MSKLLYVDDAMAKYGAIDKMAVGAYDRYHMTVSPLANGP